MPGPALTFPMQLDPIVRREWEAFLAQLNEGFLYVEHNEDGTHSDIHANSITVTGVDVGDATFSGPLEIAQWLDITPIDTATDDAQNSANNKGWTQPRILLGLVRGPNLNPATDVGIRLRGEALSSTIQPDFTISAGYDSFDAVSALVVTHMDTSQSAAAVNIPLKIGFNASLTSKFNIMPDQRTESVDGVSLGAIDFGFGSNFHGFTNILGRQIYALTACILGPPTTSGIQLYANGSGALDVRLGDNSADARVNALELVATAGGFVQSVSSKYYLGTTASTDVLLKKTATGTMGVRLGNDSGYGNLEAGFLNATTAVILPDGSAGTPAALFNSDQDTGLYWISSGNVGVSLNGVLGAAFTDKTAAYGYGLAMAAGAFGTGNVGGSFLQAGRNASGSGAAATLRLERMSGGFYYLWPDNAGLFRISNLPPEEDGTPSDTSGTVVGDQSSSRAFKDIIAERTDYETALGVVLDTPVFRFRYKDGRYNNEEFSGIVTDESPVFGKDNGKAFNEITAFGTLVLAMKAQQTQIEQLKADVEELKAVIRKWA